MERGEVRCSRTPRRRCSRGVAAGPRHCSKAGLGRGAPVLWRLGRSPAQLRREGGLLHGRSRPSRLHGFCHLNHAAASWGSLGLAHGLDHAHTHTCPRQSLLRLLRPQRRERGRVPGGFLCPRRPVLPGSKERQGSCSVSTRSDSSPSSAPWQLAPDSPPAGGVKLPCPHARGLARNQARGMISHRDGRTCLPPLPLLLE